MEDLIFILNESLKKSSSLLTLVCNAPSGDLTKSVSAFTIELVSLISTSLQHTSDVSEELKRQTRCAKDALDAVQSLQKLVKLQKATIESYQIKQLNKCSAAVMTDILEMPPCELCISNKQTIDTLMKEMKLQREQYESKELVILLYMLLYYLHVSLCYVLC